VLLGLIGSDLALALGTVLTLSYFDLCRQREISQPPAEFVYASSMEPMIKGAIPVLPAADTAESLNWWTEVCGFTETFRDNTPPTYAGINRGEAYLHIAGMDDKALARKVGDQTMVRLSVRGIEAMYAEFQKRGGKVHPNGPLQTKPWGTKEFGAVDPNGVCVTFQE
jgi:uncharacterized glyoxalase superfamily protein PhnB